MKPYKERFAQKLAEQLGEEFLVEPDSYTDMIWVTHETGGRLFAHLPTGDKRRLVLTAEVLDWIQRAKDRARGEMIHLTDKAKGETREMLEAMQCAGL